MREGILLTLETDAMVYLQWRYNFKFHYLLMNIVVTNLSLNIIEEDLFKLFSAFGRVANVRIMRNHNDGRSVGNAYIHMPVQAQAEQAIRALHRMMVDDQEISVRELEYKPGEFNN